MNWYSNLYPLSHWRGQNYLGLVKSWFLIQSTVVSPIFCIYWIPAIIFYKEASWQISFLLEMHSIKCWLDKRILLFNCKDTALDKIWANCKPHECATHVPYGLNE